MRDYLWHTLIKCYYCLILLSMCTFIKRVRIESGKTLGVTGGSRKLRMNSLIRCALPIDHPCRRRAMAKTCLHSNMGSGWYLIAVTAQEGQVGWWSNKSPLFPSAPASQTPLCHYWAHPGLPWSLFCLVPPPAVSELQNTLSMGAVHLCGELTE